MSQVQSALLFVTSPNFTFETLTPTLNRRVAFLDQVFEREISSEPSEIRMVSADFRLSILWEHGTLPAASFNGALDNLISRPHADVLQDKLDNHVHFMVISLSRKSNGQDSEGSDAHLDHLRLAHAITTLMAEWHQPQAVHWRASNQVLTGAQYLTLAAEKTPWPLFARAAIDDNSRSMCLGGTKGLCGDFTVQIDQTTISTEKAHAIALGFLRQLTQDGAAATNKSFQASTGDVVLVHQSATETTDGRTELRLVPWRTCHDGAQDRDTQPSPRADEGIGRLKSALGDIEPARAHNHNYQAKWLSYLMIFLMPPLGLALLISNTLLGPSLFRTGMMTLGSLSLAMLVFSGLSMSGNAKLTAWTEPGFSAAETYAQTR